MIWHTAKIEAIFNQLNSSREGLSQKAAANRLDETGPNRITGKPKATILQLVFRQVADLMTIVLLAAAVLSGFIGDISDSAIIILIVLLNAGIGFYQEFKARKAMEALKIMAASTARVIREDNHLEIPAEDLVPGDLVILEAGNVIPADIRLVEAFRLKIEESTLTGESHGVEKQVIPLPDENIPLGERLNMAYKGTIATFGRASGVVVATGMDTELGKIATLLEGNDQKTPLQVRLSIFSKYLAYIVLGICVFIFVFGLIRGEDLWAMLLTSISLAVAALPEALPAVIAISLAMGARRMVGQMALVRKLPAVETLGSVTYICSDKTGTLTLNKMVVQKIYDGHDFIPAGEVSVNPGLKNTGLFLQAIALNNDVLQEEGGRLLGESTEIALFEFCHRIGYHKADLDLEFPRKAEIPFDSERMCMTTVHKIGDKWVAFTKGALDVLLEKSIGLSPDQKEHWMRMGDEMATEGFRVLAFAYREFSRFPFIEAAEIESNLTLLGLTGIADPAREEAAKAVADCIQAGIVPVMITGDYMLTAKAIARKLGILHSDDDLVMTGRELSALSDEEFKKIVLHVRVYARVSPSEKLRIIKALQDCGQFVSMTGDGVNDAPSLKHADIGVAMGITGSDVAREAADMILLDDNFATIVNAVKQGRRIFDNIRKFIRYILTGNAGEIWVIFLAPFFGLPIPLLPIHILWVNLVTDGMPGIALAMEPADKGIMKRKPRSPKENIFADGLGLHILWVGFLTGVVCLSAQYFAVYLGLEHWQSVVFTILCFSQLGHALAIRSEFNSAFSSGFFANPMMWFSILTTVVLQMAILYLPLFNRLFHTQPLTLKELGLSLAISSIVFFAVETEKWIKRKTLKNG